MTLTCVSHWLARRFLLVSRARSNCWQFRNEDHSNRLEESTTDNERRAEVVGSAWASSLSRARISPCRVSSPSAARRKMAFFLRECLVSRNAERYDKSSFVFLVFSRLRGWRLSRRDEHARRFALFLARDNRGDSAWKRYGASISLENDFSPRTTPCVRRDSQYRVTSPSL